MFISCCNTPEVLDVYLEKPIYAKKVLIKKRIRQRALFKNKVCVIRNGRTYNRTKHVVTRFRPQKRDLKINNTIPKKVPLITRIERKFRNWLMDT